MNRIDAIFNRLRTAKRRGLMPFLCGGHPTNDALPALLKTVAHGGGSIVEVGIPFSDPIADGPVIAAAMHEALGRGVTPRSVFEQVGAARVQAELTNDAVVQELGIVAMMSVSLVWRMGVREVVTLAKANGIDGFIFPDLPVDEAGEVVKSVRDAGLTASFLVAPSTTPERAERIVAACTGFVYLLARAGITGESAWSGAGGTGGRGPDVASRVKMLRSMTDLPIACGFGISNAEHVRAVVGAGGADAAIVGSALVRRLSEAHSKGEDPGAAAQRFVKELASGL
jgi:tryptophan synthase alpha chain